MKLTVLPLLAAVGQAACNSLTVRTETGSFTGLIDPDFPHVRQFRSIPFAEPPVGPLRWLPPQKLPASDTHKWSNKFPASCPQHFPSTISMWNMDITKGNLVYNGAQNDTSGLVGEATSEDCLHLAVWTPTGEAPEGGWPVLFFMTGGGFYIGGVELPWQIPTSWIERSQEFIVVSVAYRINIFGFPNAKGLVDGEQNLGILDQRLALEWTRDNIAAFGGDSSRITQWGRSAGAISADIHAYAYPEDPIAEAYYMESGTIFSVPFALDIESTNFTFVAENVGCGNPCGGECPSEEAFAAAELDCMRMVSANQITNFIGQYVDRGEQPAIGFGPHPDDVIIFNDYHTRAEEGKIAKVPTLISMTANEHVSLVPLPANVTEGPDQDAVNEANIQWWVCATYNSTVYRNRLDIPVYRFQYAAEFPNLNVWEWLGAYHNSETPLVFGTYDLLEHIAPTTEFQVEVSEAMQDRILAFAKDPVNGPKELGWNPTDTSAEDGGELLRFGGRTNNNAVTVIDGVEIDGVCQGLGEYNSFP